MSTSPSAPVQRLRAWWGRLVPRERTLVALAAGLVAFALLWSVAVAPALRTLRTAEVQRHELDTRLQQMLRLQGQARAMQAQPRQNPDEALKQLEASVRQHLGVAARYAIAGDRVTVTLSGVPSPALARWLAQARTSARALPAEARLTRNAAGGWDGTVVLTLPPR